MKGYVKECSQVFGFKTEERLLTPKKLAKAFGVDFHLIIKAVIWFEFAPDTILVVIEGGLEYGFHVVYC
jgi:hypothetical protein